MTSYRDIHGSLVTYAYDGDVRIRSVATKALPLRAVVSRNHPGGCSSALFKSPEHAEQWANHPGDAPLLVAAYKRWAAGLTPMQEQLDLWSEAS